MFYMETKDGDKFFTNPESNDRAEFEKILEAKLGKDAVDMFDSLMYDAEGKNQSSVYRLRDCLDDLDHALNRVELSREELIDILSNLQDVYFDLE